MMFKCIILVLILKFNFLFARNASDPNKVNAVLVDIMNGKAPTSTQYFNNIKPVPYNPKSRPSGLLIDSEYFDEDGTLTIFITTSLKQIISLDEKNQILTTSFYLLLKWFDSRLMWDPDLYGIDIIVVPALQFWLPDIAILNSASGSNLITYSPNQNIVIRCDGISYLSLSLTSQQTRCKLDVFKYPFDYQTCSILIGSWQYFKGDVIIDVNETTFLNNNFYIKNPIWELVSVKNSTNNDMSRFEMLNEGGLYEFSSEDIKFDLILKRNPLYIMINGIFPCLILNCVVLIAYSLPFSSQVGLCMTSFLTFSVTSVRIAGDIPMQSEYLPLITLYFLLSILYTFIGLTWFIILESYSKKKKLPFLLKNLALIIQKILFCIFKKQDKKEGKSEMVDFKIKCNFCDRCDDCEKDYKKEKKKKDDKKEHEKDISAINYLAFIMQFLLIIICNTVIWLKIGT